MKEQAQAILKERLGPKENLPPINKMQNGAQKFTESVASTNIGKTTAETNASDSFMSKGRCLKADSYVGYSIENDFMPVPVDSFKGEVKKNSLYDQQVFAKMFAPSLKHEDLYNPAMIFDLVG